MEFNPKEAYEVLLKFNPSKEDEKEWEDAIDQAKEKMFKSNQGLITHQPLVFEVLPQIA